MQQSLHSVRRSPRQWRINLSDSSHTASCHALPRATKRLNLRRATELDAGFMLKLLSEPSWRRFISQHDVDSIAAAGVYLQERIIKGYDSGLGFWLVELKESQTPIGICGLVDRDYLEQTDLGFAFLEAFWGQGLAAESARSVIDFAATQLAKDALLAITVPENKSSIQLLAKLGFKFGRNTVNPNDEAIAIYELRLEA